METAIEKQEEKALQVRTPDDFIMKALENKDFDVSKLERLLEMKERWDAKQAKAAFDEALSRFQSMIPSIKRNKKGYEGNYKYAELDKIVEAIRKPLFDCGFSYKYKYRQIKKENPYTIDQILDAAKSFDFDKKKLSALTKSLKEIITPFDLEVTCILTHVQGHSEEATMIGPMDTSGFKNDIQSIGSSSSYLERYTLKGVCALVTIDEDNDGCKPKEKKPTAPIGEARFDKIVQGIKSSKVTVDEIIAIEANKNNEFTEDQIKKLRDIEDNKS